jgi:hypothetical protein
VAKKIEELIEDVDSQIVNIRTKSLDVSFNELYDMYENEELIIAPDYQRLFRWEPEKQSRFIESLILEMPVPPIFVIETDNGIYELIDGLQRISSYLHFRGIKFGEKQDESTPLELSGCDIVPDLNGYTFETLPKALQTSVYKGYKRDKIEMRGDRAEISDFPLYPNTVAGGLDCRDQTIGGFSSVVKIYAVPVVEIIG